MTLTFNFIESFESEPRHRDDFHEGTLKYNMSMLDQIYTN